MLINYHIDTEQRTCDHTALLLDSSFETKLEFKQISSEDLLRWGSLHEVELVSPQPHIINMVLLII